MKRFLMRRLAVPNRAVNLHKFLSRDATSGTVLRCPEQARGDRRVD
jgi:hypothetical protein